MSFLTKRIYDEVSPADGYRVLVDRLWPRGVSKERAALDRWLKDVAPSADLRIWFDHRTDRFAEFSARYAAELDENSAVDELRDISLTHPTVTLLYGAKNPEINHAAVLARFLS
ncbi:DUF488 family protein [Glaciihabitans sp. UYNi722]|uniref:DUF488 domain-containing protein n=1 Tax=Glaciihabitans sp. UYNi722 TaxID=3156344 RepID=UPI0033932A74